MSRAAGFALVALLAARAVVASEVDSVADFELFQYVASSRRSPAMSIALDNNGEILFACRAGRTRAELRAAGIEFADSQIEYLQALNLLVEESSGRLVTAFPIFDPEVAEALRQETGELATALVSETRAEVSTLARRLEDRGFGRHAYSVVLSYVLDGMVWDFFGEYRKVAPRRLSVRSPFWSGVVWAIRPSREFSAGTRSVASSGLTLKLSTSRAAASKLTPLVEDPSILRDALAEYAKSGKIQDQARRDLLESYGVVGADGIWAVPVIDEVEKGAVFRAAEALTEKLVDAILETIDTEALQERYGLRGPQETLVIVYHELMWDLLDGFVAEGLLEVPEFLVAPERSALKDVAGVALVVDRRPPHPNRQDPVEPQGQDAVEEI